MTVEDQNHLNTAEWEGFAVRETKLLTPFKDVVKVDPLLVAGEEGMIDRREDMFELTKDVPSLIQRNEGLI